MSADSLLPWTITWRALGALATQAIRTRPYEMFVRREMARRAASNARTTSVAAAKSALRRVHDRIRGYAGDDRELHAIMADLQSETKRFAAHLDEFSLKETYFASSNAMRMRTVEGKARKRPTGSR